MSDIAKLLMAENRGNWRSFGSTTLRELGYEPVVVRDSDEANQCLDTLDDLSAVLSDLHMDGKNGDLILAHMITNNIRLPFILISGTLSDEDQARLAKRIPFIYILSKDDFDEPETLGRSLSTILDQPAPDYSDKQDYLTVLTEFKERNPPPEIQIHADRIKGWCKQMATTHIRGGLAVGPQADFLRDLKAYPFYGPSRNRRTPRDTRNQLHELKNDLDDYAKHQLPEDSPLRRDLLAIADDIATTINIPADDETMALSEIGSRALSNMDKLTGVDFQISLPSDVKVQNYPDYIHTFRALFGNATRAASKTNRQVRVYYQDERAYIENTGTMPPETIDSEGRPILANIQPSGEFSTGYGIRSCVASLKRAGADLRYETPPGRVTAVVSLAGIGQQTRKTSGTKTRVLVYDHTRNSKSPGDKFRPLEEAIDREEFTGFEFDFKGGDDGTTDQIDLRGYDIALIHPSPDGFIDFAVNVAQQNQALRSIVISGVYTSAAFNPQHPFFEGPDSSFYADYRETLELEHGVGPDVQPLEHAEYTEETPSLPNLKLLFEGKAKLDLDGVVTEVEPAATKTRVLVYDYLGERFNALEEAAASEFPDYDFVFVGEDKQPIDEIDLSGYDIALVHPACALLQDFAVNVVKQNPNLQLIIVSGRFGARDYITSHPQFNPTELKFKYYRKFLERQGFGHDTQPLEHAQYTDQTPSLPNLKLLFEGKARLDLDGVVTEVEPAKEKTRVLVYDHDGSKCNALIEATSDFPDYEFEIHNPTRRDKPKVPEPHELDFSSFDFAIIHLYNPFKFAKAIADQNPTLPLVILGGAFTKKQFQPDSTDSVNGVYQLARKSYSDPNADPLGNATYFPALPSLDRVRQLLTEATKTNT